MCVVVPVQGQRECDADGGDEDDELPLGEDGVGVEAGHADQDGGDGVTHDHVVAHHGCVMKEKKVLFICFLFVVFNNFRLSQKVSNKFRAPPKMCLTCSDPVTYKL